MGPMGQNQTRRYVRRSSPGGGTCWTSGNYSIWSSSECDTGGKVYSLQLPCFTCVRVLSKVDFVDCAELRDNKLLGELLHMVLAAGNFLNAVSISEQFSVLFMLFRIRLITWHSISWIRIRIRNETGCFRFSEKVYSFNDAETGFRLVETRHVARRWPGGASSEIMLAPPALWAELTLAKM